MKRKDWKIKKLRKNIFDRIIYKKGFFFFRNIFLKKYKNLYLISLKPNLNNFNFLINRFNIKLTLFIEKNYKNKYNYFYLFSNFFNKNIIYNLNNFKNYLNFDKNNIDFFYNKNKFIKNLIKVDNKLNFGRNYSTSVIIENIKLDDNQHNLCFLKNKQISIYKNIITFNFFISFNIFLINNLELYKILINVYLFVKK